MVTGSDLTESQKAIELAEQYRVLMLPFAMIGKDAYTLQPASAMPPWESIPAPP